MKGIKLLFAGLLVPLVFQAAFANDSGDDIARAATRRGTTTTVTSSRAKGTSDTKPATTTASRATGTIKSGAVRERSFTNTPDDTTARTTTKTITQRTPSPKATSRTATGVQARTTSIPRSVTKSRAATRTSAPVARATGIRTPNAITNSRTASISRSATTPVTRDEMMSRDYSKCRDVFNSCMDEFCANKDSQLKRCACSVRINEFDSTKRSLDNIEDKLLDFSQRLLTVSMDKEDADALYKPTEGELAFNTKDTSESKQMLDEIAKKLNTSFDSSEFDQNLNAISLSLNIDSAFDTVDSLAGASTTAKSGTELYTAALPVCREMALEVCTPDDLKIAESGYQMLIEQDCNTVKKSYQTQVDQARTKVFEGGALLDMSRLNNHQKRNSDDILTCRRKMLDMLSDTTVCGENLGNCLDISGRYIDPTTGEAFLTTDLANLANLITRPSGDQTWTTVPGNERFIAYLNSKKKFLEPAMANCEDISDYVWNEFLEDALAQIKLAQDAKLEQVRQSCTTLTTQCLDETADSLAEFDARALSIFGVSADKTVNAMCADIRNACTALLETTGGADNWIGGMTQIATDKTYDAILQTCREVGRACIIQACTSISGNFGLCENIATSINRKSIINRTACWDEVVNCVKSAGNETLSNIQTEHALDELYGAGTMALGADTPAPAASSDSVFAFYKQMYNIYNISNVTHDVSTNIADCTTSNTNCVYDLCMKECQNDKSIPVSNDCYACRMAERIWGNCEAPPATDLSKSSSKHNKIKIPFTNGRADDTGTLLAWFAKNTGTADMSDNCRDTTCGAGYHNENGVCVPASNYASDNTLCPTSQFYITNDFTNCCNTGVYDSFGNCCANGRVSNAKIDDLTNADWGGDIASDKLATVKPCVYRAARPKHVVTYTHQEKTYSIFCLNEDGITPDDTSITDAFPNGTTLNCNDGPLLILEYDSQNPTNIKYVSIDGVGGTSYYSYDKETAPWYYDPVTSKWKQCGNDESGDSPLAPEHWSVTNGNVCDGTRVE